MQSQYRLSEQLHWRKIYLRVLTFDQSNTNSIFCLFTIYISGKVSMFSMSLSIIFISPSTLQAVIGKVVSKSTNFRQNLKLLRIVKSGAKLRLCLSLPCSNTWQFRQLHKMLGSILRAKPCSQRPKSYVIIISVQTFSLQSPFPSTSSLSLSHQNVAQNHFPILQSRKTIQIPLNVSDLPIQRNLHRL